MVGYLQGGKNIGLRAKNKKGSGIIIKDGGGDVMVEMVILYQENTIERLLSHSLPWLGRSLVCIRPSPDHLTSLCHIAGPL